MKDYYAILGVEKTATHEQINQAYRQAALKHHPDRNKEPDAAAKFKEAAEAFEVLGNEEKRRQYDNPVSQMPFNFASNHSPFDIFNTFFGGGRRQRHGIDVERGLDLTFEEAALGCEKEIKLEIKDVCPHCKGSGASEWRSCDGCGGSGMQTIRQDPFVMQTNCRKCGGVGRFAAKACDKCTDGCSGTKEETLNVNIPPGAFTGMRMRVSGKGEADQDGYRGDMYIVSRVHKHPLFTRHGHDIIHEALVPFSKMVLGGTIEVPTLRGTATVKIKPGTAVGKKMRLSGQGVQDVSEPSYVGDMFVVLNVKVPTETSQAYQSAIEELAKVEV
jgi:molecular chaperone DnaJ